MILCFQTCFSFLFGPLLVSHIILLVTRYLINQTCTVVCGLSCGYISYLRIQDPDQPLLVTQSALGIVRLQMLLTARHGHGEDTATWIVVAV